MPTRLDPILANVRERAAQRRAQRPLASLRAELEVEPQRRTRFVDGLTRGAEAGLAFIAECKRRSPSAGQLSAEVDLAERAEQYRAGGADALSILTEHDHFGGAPEDLARVAGSGLPRLRKDFVLDEGMVLESVGMGADAILLLAVCLPGEQLRELRELAAEVGLAVLLEVHDEEELERGIAVTPDCLGVNARDLTTFEVDLATVERLLPTIPAGPLRIAESGIRGPAELERVQHAGAHGVLVGEALMRAGDPSATLREFHGAVGRG